jgi:uncharacterized protein YjbI with pentapeptide repeats
MHRARRSAKNLATPAAGNDTARAPIAAQKTDLAGAATFATKANDLEALRSAVVDAAGVGAGLWLSYLSILTYLAITAGSLTHGNLFFDNPLKLPLFNVDLPLKAFFTLGPLLLLIVHIYVLLHLVLLAGKVGSFHAELNQQIADDDTRARLRRQLPSNIFVQFLAGPREVRTGILGFMLRLIAWVTLVISPLALLVLFHLQFLPYHNEPISWWHRIALAADLLLLWTLWPSVAQGETTWITMRDLRHGKVRAAALIGLAPVLLVFTIATFPGEWLDNHIPSLPFVPTKLPTFKPNSARPFVAVEPLQHTNAVASGEEPTKEEAEVQNEDWSVAALWKSMANEWNSIGWTSPHMLLVGGKINLGGKLESLWSNRLVLPGINAADGVRPGSNGETTAAARRSFRGRRFEGAVLDAADLREVDFTGAQLQGASLERANLQGALLDRAQLQGASLGHAKLQGARLHFTDLAGVSLDAAELQGALIQLANFSGASLRYADLQGALLFVPQLQGALLDYAQLQGASFHLANLNGASLLSAHLQDAFFDRINVWMADARTARTSGVLVLEPITGQKYLSHGKITNWSAETFDALNARIEEMVPKGEGRDFALRRIAILDPRTKSVEEEGMATLWAELARPRPKDDTYRQTHTERLRKVGCSAAGAPYVIRGLLRNFKLSIVEPGPDSWGADLAATFLDEAHCPGARGLSEEDKAYLLEIHEQTPPSQSPTRP